ncbi:MAG: hypothetical protein APR63_12665 [Desulfuromonas sp. SDB]|nr:MAG: hypothetical protein APR63_12665 [Desulfuromonas sp. SDB]
MNKIKTVLCSKFTVKYLLPLLSGILLGLSFPPLKLNGLIFISLVPLVISLRINRQRSFLRGWLTGITFFLIHLSWVMSLNVEGITKLLLTVGVVLLGLYLSFYPALTSWLSNRFKKPLLFGLMFASTWTGFEFLRSLTNQIGFPWGSLGYSLTRYPALIQLASWGGVYLVSLWILEVNVLVSFALLKIRWSYWVLPALLLLPWLWGYGVLRYSDMPETDPCIKIILLQPDIRQDIKGQDSPRIIQLRKNMLLQQSSQLATAHSPDLIIWPETIWPWPVKSLYLEYFPESQILADSAQSWNTSLLVGCVDYTRWKDSYRPTNSLFFIDNHGEIIKRHNKVYLVQFGEHLPFDDVFPVLTNIDLGQSDYLPGEQVENFQIENIKFGAGICFESVFPQYFNKLREQGADFLVNVTDDQWFGETFGPYQHAYMSVIRAVENRCYLLRCANTGVTMVVDPYGRIEEILPRNEQGYLLVELSLTKSSENYPHKIQFIFPWLVVALMVILGVKLLVEKIKQKRRRVEDV